MLAVPDDHLDVRRRVCACTGRDLFVDLDCDDLTRAWRDGEGERARAGPDVEDALVATQREQIFELGSKGGGTLRLQCGAPVGLAHPPSTTTR